jgi:hypothetical protein
MKKQILGWVVNLVGTFIVLAIGFGAMSVYQTIKFRAEADANILAAQREQIQRTCEAIAAQQELEEEQ